MKIGIDARQLTLADPAGVGWYVIELLKRFNEIDKENEFILYMNRKCLYTMCLGDNFSVRIIPGKIGSLWLRYKLPFYLKKDGIDIFWGPEHILPKKVKGIRYVVTIHDLALIINPKWGETKNSIIQNLFLRKSVKDADLIIAISESTQKDILKLCKVSEDKIKKIYNGFSTKKSSNASHTISTLKKYKISNDYFLYVGTIEPRKNIITLIKAFEIVRRKYNVNLVIVGKTGWKYNKIIDAINISRDRKNIIRTGYVSAEDKNNLYAGAKAFIFPSYYEGFGIPILEAMGHENIVITMENSSLREVGGNAALYIENNNDYQALANLMEKVYEMDVKARNEIITKGNAQIRKFSWDECAYETLNAIIHTVDNIKR